MLYVNYIAIKLGENTFKKTKIGPLKSVTYMT